jgi:hypothetical protein
LAFLEVFVSFLLKEDCLVGHGIDNLEGVDEYEESRVDAINLKGGDIMYLGGPGCVPRHVSWSHSFLLSCNILENSQWQQDE